VSQSIRTELLEDLKRLAIEDKKLREPLRDPKAGSMARKEALELSAQMLLFMVGYFDALKWTYSDDQRQYLREYFDQARSDRGVT
jgi:hypothetical protein